MILEALMGDIWSQCESDDDDIVFPESFFVKQRNQPKEEHHPKKLLDQGLNTISH